MTDNSKAKILVVDDTPKNIQLVAQILTREGFTVDFALNGLAALEHVANNAYDLILLDIMMPDMDGFDVCRKLKENPATSDIPVIFITAKTDSESVSKAFELGGVDYITKPFNAPELIARAKTHITIKKQKTEMQNLIAVRDRLFSIIGHDLRGPIGSTSQMLNMVLNDTAENDSEKLLEILNLTKNEIDKVYYLLENLLDWASDQRKRIAINLQPVDLSTSLLDSISILTGLIKDKQINIINKIPSTISVIADERMLKTIFRNLISNAIKFSFPKGRIIIDFHLTDDKFANISVIDKGLGMTTDTIIKILKSTESFTTLGTANEKGTGLGIRLCREFIDKMGGKLNIESSLNEGSTFSFMLPLANK